MDELRLEQYRESIVFPKRVTAGRGLVQSVCGCDRRHGKRANGNWRGNLCKNI